MKLKNIHGGNFIARSVDCHNLGILPEEPYFFSYWTKLRETHVIDNNSKAGEIMTYLIETKYVDGHSIIKHMMRFQNWFQQLENIDKGFSEEMNINFIRSSLAGTSYAQIAQSSRLPGNEQLTVKALAAILTGIETTNKQLSEQANEHSMQATAKQGASARLGPKINRSKFCKSCNSSTHDFDYCWTHNPNVQKPANRFGKQKVGQPNNRKVSWSNQARSNQRVRCANDPDVLPNESPDTASYTAAATCQADSKWKFDRKRSRDDDDEDVRKQSDWEGFGVV